MSLLSKLKGFFSPGYEGGSFVYEAPAVAGFILRSAPQGQFEPDFARYLALAASPLKDLTARYHDRSYIKYGADSPDFPLCLDFAELCAADVRKGAILQGLSVRPCFGVLEYTKNALIPETDASGSPTGRLVSARHAINFALVPGPALVYFEPQADLWLDVPDDLKSLDKFYV